MVNYDYEKRFTRHCLKKKKKKKKRENPRNRYQNISEEGKTKKGELMVECKKSIQQFVQENKKKNNESKAIQVNAVTNFFKR